MSSLFGSTTIEGNRITEFSAQNSAVGTPIPFGHGRFQAEGKILFAPMPPKEHARKKKQGKGGVKTTEYTYTLSYAIAFCEGPIAGYWTITRNGKVVWTNDPAASVDDAAYAAKWAQKATFYYGTELQLPDSTIESYKGVGQVSAFRGLAYIVVEDDDVTNEGGAVPTYSAIIIADGVDYLTSPPYPAEHSDSMGVGFALPSGSMDDLLDAGYATDAMGVSFTMIGGQMRPVRQDGYSPAEPLNVNFNMTGGEMRTAREDGYGPPESLDIGFTMVGGEMRTARIDGYSPVESLNIGFTMTGGSMYVP